MAGEGGLEHARSSGGASPGSRFLRAAVGDVALPLAHHPNVQVMILVHQVEVGHVADVSLNPELCSELPGQGGPGRSPTSTWPPGTSQQWGK